MRDEGGAPEDGLKEKVLSRGGAVDLIKYQLFDET